MQGFEKPRRVFIDRTHVPRVKRVRKSAFEEFAIFQHVRDAGRTAHVVFENVELSVGVADEIGARDVAQIRAAA